MRRSILIAATLTWLIGASAELLAQTPDAHPPSRAVADVLKPAYEAVAAERRRQTEAPPGSDREVLIHLGRLDQAVRRAVQALDVANLSAQDATEARARTFRLMEEVDQENQAAFLRLTSPGGWFTTERYGEEASRAAFLIVQHADIDLQRRYLPLLEPLVGTGQIRDGDYALMFDRVAIREGRPQRYGSQYVCRGQRSELAPVEDAARLEELRAGVGLPPMAERAARIAARDPCQLNSAAPGH